MTFEIPPLCEDEKEAEIEALHEFLVDERGHDPDDVLVSGAAVAADAHGILVRLGDGVGGDAP